VGQRQPPPHLTDTYRQLISHGGGDKGFFQGLGWYRKHFILPASAEGQKVFLEFEGLKQAAHFYLNGKPCRPASPVWR